MQNGNENNCHTYKQIKCDEVFAKYSSLYLKHHFYTYNNLVRRSLRLVQFSVFIRVFFIQIKKIRAKKPLPNTVPCNYNIVFKHIKN